MSDHDHEGHECSVCSMEGTLEERKARYWEGLNEKIAKYGHAVIGVIGGNDSFFYTIGADEFGAEMIVFGSLDGQAILNDLVEKMKERGGRFEDGEVVKLGDGTAKFGVKLIRASFKKAAGKYTFQANRYWQEKGMQEYSIIEVLVPDKNGVYPDEPGCSPPYSNQPLLLETN